ncbi:MAG: Crp/Fnr family transcriptional regulator [Fusobacterium sp.]|nr:Crp/Fnr family transcriptional regulator [Fusobacterium sp.]
MISREDIETVAKKLEFLDKLKKDDRAKIILSSRLLSLKKNSTFFTSNELKGILILKSGKLRFFISSPEGKELSVYYLEKNQIDFFVEYDEKFSILSSIGFTAEKNSEIIFIPCEAISLFSNKYLDLEKELHNLTLEKFSKTLKTLENFLFVSVKKRIINFLLTEKEKNKSDEINLTHEEIGKILGTSREVISRNLKKLEKEKFLKIYRNKVILN